MTSWIRRLSLLPSAARAAARSLVNLEGSLAGINLRLDEIEASVALSHVASRPLFAQMTELRPRSLSGKRPKLVPYDIEEKRSILHTKFPRTYDLWTGLVSAGDAAYSSDPSGNLSVSGNGIAEAFRLFLAPYMGGNVLDVGCGPQRMPLYLRGFRVDYLGGLDPLPGGERDFDFGHGLAEFLPWGDGEFDAVVFGTSLDHVLSVEMTISEVCRVLAPGGTCLVWTGLVADGKRYDPLDPNLQPPDEFHLFHFSEEQLVAAFSPDFFMIEKLLYSRAGGFFAFRKSA